MKQTEPENHTNLLLAIVLSMAVMLTWQLLFPPPHPGRAPGQKPGTAIEAPGAPGAPSSPAAGQPSGQPEFATRDAALAASPRAPIRTPSLSGSIALKGGRIDDVVLERYHETPDAKSPNIVLFSPPGGPQAYFAEYGWQSANGAPVKLPEPATLWRIEKGGTLTPESPVTLAWDNGEGLLFRRTISADSDYMFTIADEVVNTSAADVDLAPTARIARFGMPKVAGFWIQHEGLIGVPGDAGLTEIKYASALQEPAPKVFSGKTGGWIGITDKYWAAALIPPQQTPYTARLGGEKLAGGPAKELFVSDYVLAPVKVVRGQGAKVETRLFAGAKQVHVVEKYESAFNILKFDLMIDWGWFYFITKPLFYLIHWFYQFFGNFGVAVLAVTVVVKAIFFPFASKSYESMAKMKKMQPELEKLRERYKEDRPRLQQETMALYRRHKINPMAGCLPILLQIPVFFALYKVLFVSIDMRHAPFFGWIRDLSAPDPTSIFNLFGLLPFVPPEYLHLGAWPIVMGLTMWLQMQLNPPQPDPTQQMIFNWMPVIFTFTLASFPAGLVIYWTWNNILSLAQQWYIMKRQGADVPLKDNIVRTFAPAGRLARHTSGRLRRLFVRTAVTTAVPGEQRHIPHFIKRPATESEALSALGLAPGATDAEINAAYSRLAGAAQSGAPDAKESTAAELIHARDLLLRKRKKGAGKAPDGRHPPPA